MPRDLEALGRKIEALAAERIAQIADFVDFLITKERRTAAAAPSSPDSSREGRGIAEPTPNK